MEKRSAFRGPSSEAKDHRRLQLVDFASQCDHKGREIKPVACRPQTSRTLKVVIFVLVSQDAQGQL